MSLVIVVWDKSLGIAVAPNSMVYPSTLTMGLAGTYGICQRIF